MIKLKDLIKEELTDADIKVGDAYKSTSHIGLMVTFVYKKDNSGKLYIIVHDSHFPYNPK